ncbi:hypothetical protein D3C78_1068280 [compost metagenome]
MCQQLWGTFGGKTLQALLQRQIQAVAAQLAFIDGKPTQREAGGKIRQIAVRLLMVEWLMRLRCRVKGVTDQQPLFRLGEVQRLVAQRRPVQTDIDRLLGIFMTFQYTLAETGHHVIGQFAFHRRFFQQQGDKLFHAQRNPCTVILLIQISGEQVLVMLSGGGMA